MLAERFNGVTAKVCNAPIFVWIAWLTALIPRPMGVDLVAAIATDAVGETGTKAIAIVSNL